MFSLTNMPSTSSLFSTYASISASMMLGRTILNDLIPHQIRAYLFSTIRRYFSPKTSLLTLIIEEENGFSRNEVYDAAETYLCTKISPKTDCLKISKTPRDKNFTIRFEKGEKMVDIFQGAELKWRFVCTEQERPSSGNPNSSAPTSEKRHFELCFDKKHREIVMDLYLPFILSKLKEVKEGARVVNEVIRLVYNEVAEELMRTGDAEVALDGLVKLLKRKRIEEDECTTNARPKRHKNGKMMSNNSNGRIA
ncbi:AAA-type ATPase, N-terminal domain [Dillenia turbinata]|uniref:AAA-type ATPase, N-terminal domain n=1 Tax=Dillenia turbinata TaxID=194707 RepID=A0AAN8V3U3_9MAGN